MNSPDNRPGAVLFAFVTATCVSLTLALAQLGSLVSAPPFVSPAWPVTGVALASVIWFGRRALAGLALGTYGASILSGGSVTLAGLTAIGVALGSGLAGGVLRRWVVMRPQLDRAVDVHSLGAAALLILSTCSATLGVAGLLLAGHLTGGGIVSALFQWWWADAVSTLVVAPAMLTLGRLRRCHWAPLQALEWAAIISGVAFLTMLNFAALPSWPPAQVLLAAIPPIAMIATAVRLGPGGAAFASLSVSIIVVVPTLRGIGPFFSGASDASLVIALAYVGAAAYAAQILGATVATRRRDRDALHALAVGTAGAAGDNYYRRLVTLLPNLLEAECAIVLATLPSRPGELHVLATSNSSMVALGEVASAAELPLAPGGAGGIGASRQSSRIAAPRYTLFDRSGVTDVAGIRLGNVNRDLIGAVLLLNRRRFPHPDLTVALLDVAGSCVGAEIERQRADQRLRDYSTALEIVNAAYAEARRAAEAAAEAKSAFLANVSHELRTPMTAILGFAEALEDEVASGAERLNAARTIRRNGEHLLALINDVLDFSKIEAGGAMIERTHCSPLAILADVASLLRGRAEARGLEFHIKFSGPIPERIHSDPTRIRQILLNLVGNAIKFTHAGEVRLEVTLQSGREPTLAFDVRDTGVGLAEEQVGQLFQPFTQAAGATTRQYGGTGLGLTISRRLARLLGGDTVLIASTPGGGAHFRATVGIGPLDDVRLIEEPTLDVADSSRAGGRSPAIPADALAGCTVLLAEDGPDNQRLIAAFLKKSGAQVRVVANGRAAVEAALASRHGRRDQDPAGPYDVILMDMQMPEMDGYEATRTLRERGYTGTIVALTARAVSGDRQQCLEAGCTEYAAKPISRARLVELVNALRPRSESARMTGDSN